MPVVEIFKALGDPIRLEMIRRLSDGSTYSVGELSSGLGVTRQGARKHIQSLDEAKLVSLKNIGRETKVSLDTTSLADAKLFITKLELRWDQRLHALREFVEHNDS